MPCIKTLYQTLMQAKITNSKRCIHQKFKHMILGFCFKQLGLVKILQLSVMVTSYLHKLFYLFELEGVKNTKRLAPWETVSFVSLGANN